MITQNTISHSDLFSSLFFFTNITMYLDFSKLTQQRSETYFLHSQSLFTLRKRKKKVIPFKA